VNCHYCWHLFDFYHYKVYSDQAKMNAGQCNVEQYRLQLPQVLRELGGDLQNIIISCCPGMKNYQSIKRRRLSDAVLAQSAFDICYEWYCEGSMTKTEAKKLYEKCGFDVIRKLGLSRMVNNAISTTPITVKNDRSSAAGWQPPNESNQEAGHPSNVPLAACDETLSEEGIEPIFNSIDRVGSNRADSSIADVTDEEIRGLLS
jgi:hypothetical protein